MQKKQKCFASPELIQEIKQKGREKIQSSGWVNYVATDERHVRFQEKFGVDVSYGSFQKLCESRPSASPDTIKNLVKWLKIRVVFNEEEFLLYPASESSGQ